MTGADWTRRRATIGGKDDNRIMHVCAWAILTMLVDILIIIEPSRTNGRLAHDGFPHAKHNLCTATCVAANERRSVCASEVDFDALLSRVMIKIFISISPGC